MARTLLTATSALVLLLAVIAPAAHAQIAADAFAPIAGTTWVVAFPDTTTNRFDARYPNQRFEDKAFLYIYAAVDARVSITGDGYQRNDIAIAAGRFQLVDLTDDPRAPRPFVDRHCLPVASTFRIESDQPIVVYQFQLTRFGSEAWTPLPVSAWGNEYFAAAHPGEIVRDIDVNASATGMLGRRRAAPSEILVIAAYDDTKVTIVPNGIVSGFCNPTNITLQAGQAYQIQSFVDTSAANAGAVQPDFGGSRIFATKPVGVISGNTRASVGTIATVLAGNSAKNMLVEWLAPREMFGTEFVYTPTWDSRRLTGAPGEIVAQKRQTEIVRIYGADDEPTSGHFIQEGAPIDYDRTIVMGGHLDIAHVANRARVHRTDRPAQAMMSSVGFAVEQFYQAATWIDTWGGAMVTLVPRERWSSFAPFYAAQIPAGVEHYVNVVVDSLHKNDVYLANGSPFLFQRAIPGTDLVWGSMAVLPGASNHLEGRNGARFTGHVYGTYTKGGREERRQNDYEEYHAVAYAYPLAAENVVVGEGDSLAIETSTECSATMAFARMRIEVEAVNANPVGLKEVRLENAVNMRLGSTAPNPLTGAVKATILVEVIDPTKDASATVAIVDRTGKIARVPYVHRAETLDLSATSIDFGVVSSGVEIDRQLRVANGTADPITITAIRMAVGGRGFTIAAPTTTPITLGRGEAFDVIVRAMADSPDQLSIDTVIIETSCGRSAIPVSLETTNPCINSHDLDFGTIRPGESKSLPLRICNDGGGAITFSNPNGGPVLEWDAPGFSVSQADLVRLAAASLSRGDCISLAVEFSSATSGIFADTARLWASTRRCRDTSIWIVRVEPTSAAPTAGAAVTALHAAEPNPSGDVALVPYDLATDARATLALFDDRGRLVTTLVDGHHGAGRHVARIDVSALPSGVYHCRLAVGNWSATRTLVVAR